VDSLILQNWQACLLCWEGVSQEHAQRQKAVVIVRLYLMSNVTGASANCSGTTWCCKYHTCVEAGLCCCCTVALLGLAFALDGCKSREPFFTAEGRPLVLGLKDSVCIVLQSSNPGHQCCAYWHLRKSKQSAPCCSIKAMCT